METQPEMLMAQEPEAEASPLMVSSGERSADGATTAQAAAANVGTEVACANVGSLPLQPSAVGSNASPTKAEDKKRHADGLASTDGDAASPVVKKIRTHSDSEGEGQGASPAATVAAEAEDAETNTDANSGAGAALEPSELHEGLEVDVFCTRTKMWLPAKIESVVANGGGCVVHFMGWNKNVDETISPSSCQQRIAAKGSEAAQAWAEFDQRKAARQRKALERQKAKEEALVRAEAKLPSEDVEPPSFVQVGATRSGRRLTKRVLNEGAVVQRKKKTASEAAATKKKSAVESAREIQEESPCGACGEYEDDALTDMIFCDGGCLNSYHISCLGLDSVPEEDTWLCEQCRTNEQQCFACGRNGTIGERGGVFRCSVISCGKFYHQSCISGHKLARRFGRGAKSMAASDVKDGADVDDGEDEEEASAFRSQFLLDRNFDSVVVDFNLRLPNLYLPPNEPLESDTNDYHHFRLQIDCMETVKKQPPTYRTLVRNIYTFKQTRENLEDIPMCVCKEKCGDDCINRLSFIECFGSPPTVQGSSDSSKGEKIKEFNCPLGENCGNRALHQRIYPRFERFHTAEKGWGLKVLESVKAGQLVIEYVGEVINEEEKNRRLNEHARLNPEDKNMYIMELSNGVYIDARHKGNCGDDP
ncbi:hypothetical protein ATCC90586_005889 [Pythium insidiosum]|nr:hypothetical protein ATCC90586_005889 [Pythium insidiosum]